MVTACLSVCMLGGACGARCPTGAHVGAGAQDIFAVGAPAATTERRRSAVAPSHQPAFCTTARCTCRGTYYLTTHFLY